MQLPDRPARTGQPDPVMDQALRLAAAVDEALGETPTAYRDDSPLPAVGTTPPVPQPGQPPMSQWAVDASGVLKAVAVASLPVGGGLWLVGQVDPVALALICGTPVAAALALARLISKIRNTVEPNITVTKNYYGTVHHDERTVTSTTRGVIANTRNQAPR
ncbi:hypothetical protein [Streptomyces drozdowiczii]|uniref:hypothetical protein n=1 Tax=Streptomyces drozdowiczii TaxID=202862 RepID=UPI00403CAF6F